MSAAALKLIKHCFETNDPYLDLGNCGLTDAHVAEGTEFDKLLGQCTHVETLILSNSWWEWDEKENFTDKRSQNKVQKNRFSAHHPSLKKLVNLKKLILAGENDNKWGITNIQIPGSLTQLERLNLSFNQITKIEGLNLLTKLNQLDLSGNLINKIEGLHKLAVLNQLILFGNQITKIEGLDLLTELNHLGLSGNQITKIEGVEQLKALKQLDLYGNQITKIEGLDLLTDLNHLGLSGNQITKIEGLDLLTKLNQLYLSGNQITKIEGLDKLKALMLLGLSNNLITNIEGLDKLKALKQLYLSGNKITKIERLDKLTAFKQNGHSNIQITKSEGHDLQTALNLLDLSGNQISQIEGLDKLKALNQLDLSNNQITKIEGLEKLEALNQLNLSFNQITKIEGLEWLKEKQEFELFIFANPLDKSYQLKLHENENHFPFIKDLLFRLDPSGTIPLKYPIKVLVLGNHASGKSSLVNCLIQSKQEGSTNILRIVNYFIEPRNKKGKKLPDAIFYDFGGQDFYHGLYQAFISQGGLQLVLFNNQTDRNDYGKDCDELDIIHFHRQYWLGQKNYALNEDPYIMVQTYLEEEDSKVTPFIDYNIYKGYKKSFFLSLKTELSKAQEEDADFYQAGRKVFHTYFKGLIKKAIDIQDNRQPQWYIDFLAYLFNKSNFDHSPTQLKTVLQNYQANFPTNEENLASLKTNLITLHRHGLIIYYDTPGLQDVVWLNPEKLVKHIQEEILKKELIKTPKGIIPKKRFEKDIVKNDEILKLLKEQKVVFLYSPTGKEQDEEYILPNYLPFANENDPGYQLFVFGLQQPDFSIKFNDFIPFGFINQLVCFYGFQPDAKKFWRNQLLFTLNKEARVLIQLDFPTLQVKVFIQLLPNSKSSKNDVSTYLFFSLLALYWDKGNDFILNFNEYLNQENLIPPPSIDVNILIEGKKIKGSLKKNSKFNMWNALKEEKSNVPPDAYLSVDGNRFIKYEDLFNLEGSYLLPGYLLTDGRINPETAKEIPVSPFAPFTHKKLAGIKKVFISYSHDDMAMMQTLYQYLINLQRDGLIELWLDGMIQAGDDWDKKIKTSLETADICILLMSQSFIASNYVHEVEFKAIMEKGLVGSSKVIPVLIKDCDWKNWRIYPKEVHDTINSEDSKLNISRFQFLPDENKRLKAITKWPHPEEAWLLVADAIRKFCEEK